MVVIGGSFRFNGAGRIPHCAKDTLVLIRCGTPTLNRDEDMIVVKQFSASWVLIAYQIQRPDEYKRTKKPIERIQRSGELSKST